MTRPRHEIRTRPPIGPVRLPELLRRPEEIEPFLIDAAHFPGGRTPVVALPRAEGEVAGLLREAPALLVVGAQSSLTGGATPRGEWVACMNRMTAIAFPGEDRVRVEAGVPLLVLQEELGRRARFYPAPTTFSGALMGGTAATNAAGPATFKYGTTRDWVRHLTVVLAGGEVLEIPRGEFRAHADGYFEVRTIAGGGIRVPVPAYRMPAVRKRSAGYHAEPEMDLLDLFIGSEGTLGVITGIDLETLPVESRPLTAWLGCPDEAVALDVAAELRAEALRTRAERDPAGLDVAALEFVDRAALDLVRGTAEGRAVSPAPEWDCALYLEVELPAAVDGPAAREAIAAFDPAGPHDSPLKRLCALLDRRGLLGDLRVALPDEPVRAGQIRSLREAVPMAVNHRIGALRRRYGDRVRKVAGDMIVPAGKVAEAIRVYREGFGRRGLDCAIWGHVSDGNLHPNLLPRGPEDIAPAEAAILEFGAEVLRLGGCPLAEHGVGRDPIKQELLRRLYGTEGVDEMRRVKRALDPEFRLAPGVLFPAEGPAA